MGVKIMTESEKEKIVALIAAEYTSANDDDDYEEGYKMGLAVATRIIREFDEKKQEFVIDKSALTPMEFFSLVCIQERELLYICINIFNKREKRKSENLRYPLKNTFTILSSQRDLVERKYLNELQDFDNYIFKSNEETNINLE